MKFLFLLAGILVLGGCAHQPPSPPRHEWFRPAAASAFEQATPLPASHVRPVAAAKIAEASLRLQNEPAIRISEAEALDLLGSPLEQGGDLLLVRGLCIGCGTGRFTVYEGEHHMIVSHMGLASLTASETAWPVVVKAAKMPAEVYVDCGAAV